MDFTNTFPFPTETTRKLPALPYIAFNYLGQLTFDGQKPRRRATNTFRSRRAACRPRLIHEQIPLLQRQPLPATVSENPPGNSTNSTYNLVHIDALTGRAALEFQKVQ